MDVYVDGRLPITLLNFSHHS